MNSSNASHELWSSKIDDFENLDYRRSNAMQKIPNMYVGAISLISLALWQSQEDAGTDRLRQS